MENASRALIMAAGIIVGVLIISVAVALYSMFGSASKNIIDEIEHTKIIEFNNNFYIYYGEGVRITAHDIVTIANFAKKCNEEAQIENTSGYSQNSDYIQIDVKNKGKSPIACFEKKNEVDYANFIKENMLINDESGKLTKTKLYKVTNIITNIQTGKVIYMNIEEI